MKMNWLLCMLEGQKEGIPEQPEQSVTEMVLVPLGTEISILSPGKHGVGRAGLTGNSLAQLRARASGSRLGSLVGAPGAGRVGSAGLGCSPAAASQQAGAPLLGCPGAAPQREGWILAAFNEVWKDKSAVPGQCPWGLSSSGLGQSRCRPVVAPGGGGAGRLRGWCRACREHSKQSFAQRVCFARAGGAAPPPDAAAAPAARSAQLRSG